jgi:hypothetical protein
MSKKDFPGMEIELKKNNVKLNLHIDSEVNIKESLNYLVKVTYITESGITNNQIEQIHDLLKKDNVKYNIKITYPKRISFKNFLKRKFKFLSTRRESY